MRLNLEPLPLVKRRALTISRGTISGSTNLLLTITAEELNGFGEMAPVSSGDVPENCATALEQLQGCTAQLNQCSPWEYQRIEEILLRSGVGPAARSAVDIALHDWYGKRTSLPLWKLLGLDRSRIVPTSVTIGINSPEGTAEHVREVLQDPSVRYLKVKLGSPEGAALDRQSFDAAQAAANRPVGWRVDANGGWTLSTAKEMTVWLAERGVELLEQPLPRGQEQDLAALHAASPLPLFLDESVRNAADIPPYAANISGVNLKLMKCGGIRPAIQIIHTARSHGLKVMIGCFSESSLSISAAAHISPLVDYLDLDSHLNLAPDPFCGAAWVGGAVVPGDLPGLGVTPRTTMGHS